MSSRDPRSRPEPPPAARANEREPTQSLQLEIDPLDDDLADSAISHPSLALGTHEKGEHYTRVASPSAQRKLPSSGDAPRERSRPPPADPDDPAIRIGVVLGGYRVLQLLGKGGMGYVYRAEHVKLGREVALKLLRGDYARRRDAVARFFQEARTVNRVRHRNIVDVENFVELEDGTTFIIMELLHGVSLGAWARTGIDLPRALAVLVQICDGLGAAHAVGVIHRDLKPDNVSVARTADGGELVKLLDFGVAKLLNRDDEDVGFETAAGSVIGTPAYMSPEQAGGMTIDHRSDIYSLGAIMYELFCGQPMFRGRSFGEYVRKHLTEMPPRPRATPGGKDLDERIEALILKCLEKEPAQRFGHILELREGLLHLLGGDPHSASYGAVGVLPMPALPASGPVRAQTHPTPSPGASLGLQRASASANYSVNVAPIPSMVSMTYMPPPPAVTPWWVWTIGGVVAISLGVGGALFYAGGGGTAPAPSVGKPVQMAVVPAPTPAPAPAPKVVPVRFDSLPSAGVFADGRSAELCRTPCAFDVDLADGGPVDKRAYVVRVEGYLDQVVTVDLTAAHPDAHVTLVRTPAAPVPPPTVAPTPIPPTANATPTPTPKHPARPPVHVDAKKPTETIDQSETLDPFHTK